MKLKQGLIITPVGNEHVAVAAGEAGRKFHGMIHMNDTAVYITELLREERTEEELCRTVAEYYGITDDVAKAAVRDVLAVLRAEKLLKE